MVGRLCTRVGAAQRSLTLGSKQKPGAISLRAFVFVGVLDSVSVEAGRQKWMAPEIINCGLQNQCGCVEAGIASGPKRSLIDSRAPATSRDHRALNRLQCRERIR